MRNTNRPRLSSNIYIENCTFIDNYGSPGSAVAIHQEKSTSTNYFIFLLKIYFNNCTFAKNSYPQYLLSNYLQNFEHDILNTMALYSTDNVSITNCWFEKNNGTAIYACNSQIYFNGIVTFLENSGVNGGGIFLSGDSLMLLLPDTHVYLLNNSALGKGGGIFLPPKNLGSRQVCFFKVHE